MESFRPCTSKKAYWVEGEERTLRSLRVRNEKLRERRGRPYQPIYIEAVGEIDTTEVKDDLSRFLREAETQDVVITRHGKPAGVLIGLKSEDDWFNYRLENDPRFLQRVEQARAGFRAGRGVRLEEVK
jgi:prevent-host-death family protein